MAANKPASESTPAPRLHRPSAPNFDFSPRDSSERSCSRCGTVNPSTGRFCLNCGEPLEARTSVAPKASMPAPPRHSAPPQVQASPPAGEVISTQAIAAQPPPAVKQPILAAPVVGVKTAGDAPAAAAGQITCSRCRGVNSTVMHFCQYCGARLASGPEEQPQLAGAQQHGPLPPLPVAPAYAPSPQAPSASYVRPHEAHSGTSVQFAGSQPAIEARLVVIGQDGKPGREYTITGEQTDIGREEGDIVLPNDPYVSPRHARLSRRNGRFFVRDLESVNGVYVRLRAAERLQHADLVLVGLEVLRFEIVSDAEKGLGPAAERGTQIFGSPSVPRNMRLCQRTVEGVTRDVYYPARDEAILGREVGDIVFTNDPFMSRRHAAIVRDPANNTFTLRDLGSSNGTYIAIRGDRELASGDHVRIGQHLFRLDVGPSGANR